MVRATSGPTTQSALQQFQLQQARQRVAQAEQRATALQTEAVNAQASVVAAQAQANSLWQQTTQAQLSANQQSQQLQTATALGNIGATVANTLTAVLPKAPPMATLLPKSTVNTQGQTIGTVINTKA